MLKDIARALGMTNTGDPVVQFKVKMLTQAMPADATVVFGDIWKVNGFYTKKTLELGCKRVVLIDSLETSKWLETRLQYPQIDFFKGDFSNPMFMKSILEKFDLGVAFDILLHQPPLLNTLHLILEKIDKRVCVVQPMLREQKFPNTLIYLPGNNNDLYPLKLTNGEYRMFDISQVNQSHWIWGMTATFLHAVLKGEGFDLIYEEELGPLENEKWYWGGYLYEKKCENVSHWSRTRVTPGLYPGKW